MKRIAIARLALGALAVAAFAAHAGGPLVVCNGSPTAYPIGTPVNLNYDQGTLGPFSKAQADAMVNSAISLWTGLATASVPLARGADMPVDITTSNYLTYWDNLSDAYNPVMYDTDGSIINLQFGAGQSSVILGIGGSGYSTGPTCQYLQGQLILNGSISGTSSTTMTTVAAHELGHFIGLDHTQLDNAGQGLAADGSNYPLMYPIAYRNTVTLGPDDAAAISVLYPNATTNTSYGALTGYFTLADGITPVRGANIWVQDVSNPANVFSIVSDYLMQGNGYFKVLLPPGTYTLHAQAIETQFRGPGGSTVGPYATSSTDYSFQAPLYVGGVAMTPLTLGNATPTQFTITAGCTATAAFHFDGSGSIGGNCGGASTNPPRLGNISTRGQVLTGNNVMIGGFVIGGTTNKTVVVRARGPSLIPYGITNALANPTLQLVRSSDNSVIATNDDWGTATNAAQITASGFAPSNPLESAILVNLPPGAYTAIVQGSGGVTGVGIVEVFEVDTPTTPLANISTRGQVLSGNDVMIGGFIVQGSGPQNVVVRARGPSLIPYGITNALADPTLKVVRSSDNSVVATNDNWQTDVNAGLVTSSGFAPSTPLESALYLTLQPGAYTAIVQGAGGGTGVGIVEVFTAP